MSTQRGTLQCAGLCSFRWHDSKQLYQGLQLSRPMLSRWPVSLPIALSGMAVELLAWLHTIGHSDLHLLHGHRRNRHGLHL